MSEADNLDALFKGITRRKFAADHHVPGGEAMIYQHTKGIKPIGLEAAIAYANGFRLPLEVISPTWAEILSKLQTSITKNAVCAEPSAPYTVEPAKVARIEDPLITELTECAKRLNKTGLARLVERARTLVEEYPASRQNSVN